MFSRSEICLAYFYPNYTKGIVFVSSHHSKFVEYGYIYLYIETSLNTINFCFPILIIHKG